MRIIAGKHKHRKLVDSKNYESICPTTDKTREALFSILINSPIIKEHGFQLVNADILDVFCGTGAVALEALSRGAKFATLIDNDAKILALAKKNAQILEEEASMEFLLSDVSRSLPKAKRKYDMVFLDPPYKEELLYKALDNLQKNDWLSENLLVVIEHEKNKALDLSEDFTFLDTRRYGKSRLSFFCFKCSKK